jgi:predicted RNA-binding Zn-ribbon protein involved in translation (DUF1610 family)
MTARQALSGITHILAIVPPAKAASAASWWGSLDFPLVDLPPSAGQPQQALLERLAISAVVIVATPQDMSLLDSSRSVLMCRRAGTPVLGLVENMSYFVCPACGEHHELFSWLRSTVPRRLASWQSPAACKTPWPRLPAHEW